MVVGSDMSPIPVRRADRDGMTVPFDFLGIDPRVAKGACSTLPATHAV